MQKLIKQKNMTETIQDNEQDTDIKSIKLVVITAVILGLFMNWLGLYLRISMGFIGISMGSMAILLIAKYIFSKRDVLSKQNLVIVTIVFGATAAVEAAMSLLFLIWLTTNIEFYNYSFNPPDWLLPSQEVLTSKQLFTSEWLYPLLTHYFLMTVPGGIGIAIGMIYRQKFMHDDEKYPFPGVIQQDTSINVLTDESETKGPVFWRVAKYSFIVSLITTFIPFLLLIDLSNPTSGFIVGVILGPIGISLFAAGILIGKPKISIGSAVASIFGYSVLSIFLIGGIATSDPMEFFSYALSDLYMSPAIGLLLGGLILGPIVWGIISSIISIFTDEEIEKEKKTEESKSKDTETGDKRQTDQLEGKEDTNNSDNNPLPSLFTLILSNKKFLLPIVLFYVGSILFLYRVNIFHGFSFWIIIALMTWILIIGGFVNGYLTTVSTAQSGATIVPPFIFDSGAIFVTGATGIVPFVATPLAESDGTVGIVKSQKLANQNNVSSKLALKAYIIGYIAATITTPIFSLLLWSALGIGTTKFPAPAFPVQGALVMAFATRNIGNFLSVPLLLIFLGIGIVIAKYSTELALGIAIGLFFPPHLAIPLALGGIVRIIWNHRKGDKVAKEQSSTIAPAIAVGASFVVPLLVLASLLF